MYLQQMINAQQWLYKAGFSIAPIMLERLREYYKIHRKLVLVLSHTTTHDFLLGLLLFGCLDLPITIFTHFQDPLLRWIVRQMSPTILVKSPSSSKSTTNQIIDFLKSRSEFVFLVALSPTCTDARVHSGYFYIASELEANIAVIGWDYMSRTGYVSPKDWNTTNRSYSDFQAKEEMEILSEIQRIYPFKPHFQVGFDAEKYSTSPIKPSEVQAPHLLYLVYLVLDHRGWFLPSVIASLVFVLCVISILCRLGKKNRQKGNHL